MAKNTAADLDTTSANNTDVLGQSTAGAANANTIDTLFQNTLALIARTYGDIGGLGTVGGSANAITLASLSTYQALEAGLILTFKAASSNTTATTLNLDSLGVKAVRRKGDTALAGGEIVANGIYTVIYDAAYNAAAGAWVLMNPEASASTTGQTTVASATTTDIGASSTVEVIISGTTTITGFGTVAAGTYREGYFSGALTLTYNATSLILPGAVTITTVAGDSFGAVSLGSGNWKVLWYERGPATQAQMEAATDLVARVTPGKVKNHPGVLKGWALLGNLSTTPIAAASHNVSSIGDDGVGLYTVNWTTSFSSLFYPVTVTAESSSSTTIRGATYYTLATGSVKTSVVDEAASGVDANTLSVMAAGDQ